MKRPNKKDYTSRQGFAIIGFSEDMIKYADQLEKDNEDLKSYVEHQEICDMRDNTKRMWDKKRLENFKPDCTCGLDKLLRT